MAFPNVYTHRKVAETAARGCEVCFKPTSSVLITAENKDFFYICPSHLKERTFCTPVVDKAAEEAKKKRDEEEKEKKLKEEIERLKREYEEKKKKKDKEKEKDKDGKDEKEKEEKEKETDEKKDGKDGKDGKDSKEAPADEPRVFALQKFVYQQRLEKRRQVEIAKRNRERLAAPGYFPSVPKGAP